MNDGKKFLEVLPARAKRFAPHAIDTCARNEAICEWLLDPLARWTERAYGGKAFEDAAQGYAKYCMHVGQCQQRYEQEGRYVPQEFSQVVANVYEDEQYMIPYMWAAILIYAYWPSMINHIVAYRRDFLDVLDKDARVLELACGHGVMGLLAAEHRRDIRVEGVDISPAAIGIANKLTAASGHGDRVRFEVKDALNLNAAGPSGTYQGVIAAMLAEHLSEPRGLFATVAHHLAPTGIAFFSTALESAQPDHIYEYHVESEPIRMAEEAGLRVRRLISDGDRQAPGRKFRPRALAMILEHR